VFLVGSRTGRVSGRDCAEHPVEFGVEGRIGREGRQELAGHVAWRVDPAEAEPAGETVEDDGKGRHGSGGIPIQDTEKSGRVAQDQYTVLSCGDNPSHRVDRSGGIGAWLREKADRWHVFHDGERITGHEKIRRIL
jgi:hypothetical protein